MASPEEATAPEHAQDQLVERHIDLGAEVAHLLLRAEAADHVLVLVVGLRIEVEHLTGDGDFALVTRLAIVDAHVAAHLELPLRVVDDVEDEWLELIVAKDVDPL